METRESLVTRSFAIVRQHFALLWITAVWPHFCIALCWIAVTAILRIHPASGDQPNPLNLWQSLTGLEKTGVLTAFIVTTSLPRGLAEAGIATVVWKNFKSGVATFRDALAGVTCHLAQLIILSICLGVIIEMGSAFFILPGFVTLMFTAFAIPVLVIERSGILAAINRSFTLVFANPMPILGLILLSFLLGGLLMVCAFVVALSLSSPNFPWWVRSAIFWTCLILAVSVTQTIVATILTQMYIDIRSQREEIAVSSALS